VLAVPRGGRSGHGTLPYQGARLRNDRAGHRSGVHSATGTSPCYRARGSNAGPVGRGLAAAIRFQAVVRPTRPCHRGTPTVGVTGVWPPTGGRWPNKPTVEREDLSGRRSARSASWDGGDTGRDDRGPQGFRPARTGSTSERRSLTARSEIGLLLELLSRRERRSRARRVLRVHPGSAVTTERRPRQAGTLQWAPTSETSWTTTGSVPSNRGQSGRCGNTPLH
jgi:hypothetical protein